MDIAALLAIGGALGLTAAAVVRWLNGGDFVLFPPPTQSHEGGAMNPESHTVPTREIDVENDEENTEDEDDNEEAQQSTMEVMQKVTQILETQCSQQERILQQLSNFTTKQVTDQSMNLLRNHTTLSTTSDQSCIAQELEEIKTELMKLSSSKSENGNDLEWKKQLEKCLTQLQECLKRVETLKATSFLNTTAVAAAVSTDTVDDPPIVTMSSSLACQPRTTPVSQSPENSKPFLLREAIRKLAEENEAGPLRAGAQMLYMFVINLSSHPHVPRYQKIFTSNESFQMVNQLKGGKDLLVAVGFEEKGNCFEWQGGSDDDCDTIYLKEAAAALSILKSCGDDTKLRSMNALSVLRSSTPPPAMPSAMQTPVFIASPPIPKKHPLLDESSGEDSILDISYGSEHFESRLESLAQPVMDEMRMFDTPGAARNVPPNSNLSMRDSEESGETKEENGTGESEEE